MKSISFKLDENKVVNTSAWLISLIQFAKKLNFFDAFKPFSLKMKSISYTNLNRLQTLIASIVMGCNYTNDINEKLVPDVAAAKLLGMDIFPDQSQINRFLNRFDETNIDQVVKGYSTQQSKNLAKSIQEHQWQEINIQVHVAEVPVSTDLRIIVCEFIGKDGQIKYSHLLTNIKADEMDTVELFHFYNKRQTIEAFFKTCKEVYGMKNLRTSKFYGIYGFLLVSFYYP